MRVEVRSQRSPVVGFAPLPENGETGLYVHVVLESRSRLERYGELGLRVSVVVPVAQLDTLARPCLINSLF